MYLNPVAISVIIVGAIIFVGAFIAYFRDRKVYGGHKEYASDARDLAKKLDGEIFRDGEDLVINGTRGGKTVVIRLSFAENTPGLHIRMAAPANFRMSVVPKGARSSEGKVQVRTGDESFDARFLTKSDHPTQAKMFLGSKGVLSELGKLGCQSQGFVNFSTGAIEHSEALVPTPSTGKHIQEHLLSMERLASDLARMPFADRVDVKPLKRDRRLLLRLAIVAGIITALVGIITAAQQPGDTPPPSEGGTAYIPPGMLAMDAAVLGSLQGWHLAIPDELDPDAGAWAQNAGQKTTGRFTADFDGERRAIKDSVYLLVSLDGQRRLVIIVNNKVRYDVKYSHIGLVAIVPKANLARIQWKTPDPKQSDGDAVLILRGHDHSSGLLLYFSDGKLESAVPSDYQSINLLE